MMAARLACLLFSMFIISGCTQLPVSTSYPYNTQRKMQAVHHWDVLAEDVAKQVKETLKNNNCLGQSVFVQSNCGAPKERCSYHSESSFGEGFYDLLITQLVNRGVAVSTEEDGALIVTSKAQVVYHRAKRPVSLTGPLAVLTAGVFVVREALLYWDTPAQIAAIAGTAIGASAINDATGIFTKVPHSEVIITTSIVKEKSYLMRKTDIYYINDADFWHYKASPATKSIQVVD